MKSLITLPIKYDNFIILKNLRILFQNLSKQPICASCTRTTCQCDVTNALKPRLAKRDAKISLKKEFAFCILIVASLYFVILPLRSDPLVLLNF